MELDERYQDIQKKLEELSDFSIESLALSRNLFHLETDRIVPKRFEVWTLLVGLPLPNELTANFLAIANRIIERLPPNTRFYPVIPENYHWELFIIKRPHEEVDNTYLQNAPDMIKEVLRDRLPFTISYRGFLITPDGTIIVKGYGEFDELRSELRQKLPQASLKQSNLGHISLGRLLDPVGHQCFTELNQLVGASHNEFYGELEVNAVKYVHESQWYMEEKEVVAILPFRNSVT